MIPQKLTEGQAYQHFRKSGYKTGQRGPTPFWARRGLGMKWPSLRSVRRYQYKSASRKNRPEIGNFLYSLSQNTAPVTCRLYHSNNKTTKKGDKKENIEVQRRGLPELAGYSYFWRKRKGFVLVSESSQISFTKHKMFKNK